MSFHIKCTQCGNKAYVKSGKTHTTEHRDIYCGCSNMMCGHTFVMTLSFSHTISPSVNDSKKIILDLLKSMPQEERQRYLELSKAG